MDGMAMSITDEELGRAIYESPPELSEPWDELEPMVQQMYVGQARLVRRLLCPPSPAELRMERGKAAWEARFANGWESLLDHTQELYCQMADAVLAKKAEQDGERT